MPFIIFNDNIYIVLYQIHACLKLSQDFGSLICVIPFLLLVLVFSRKLVILASRNEAGEVRRLVEINKLWVLPVENNLPSSFDGYEVLGEVLIVSRKVKK